MTVTVRRITISLPKAQVKSLKNVSKMLNRPVSSLVSELIGEAVESFEELVVHRDTKGARERIAHLSLVANSAIDEVDNVSHQ